MILGLNEPCRLFIEMFNPRGFDITIAPSNKEEFVVFRGVLDKKWLRVQPDFLRSLYGGSVASKWTMVGQVTYIPREDVSEIDELEEVNEVTEEISKAEIDGLEDETQLPGEIDKNEISEETPSMRDPFRNMFHAAREFDRMLLESEKRIEVIVAPLAIYHEIIIPDVQAEE